ncbi:flagellar hook protein FlgE [Azospirillum lipoferum]|uniref:Flagellar hook protein FlgE n=1 Tax=Azospirillum lipoferum TaxID=193 RepID=A0A5A9GDI5_AZOLI|nr:MULTISPECIES: flagellar hook-basal body complex protein [Azospirillum]KAA0592558.1 flagellar hook-basal body complex protein [Azospirillum lipoferum]MCP1614453.1 flagellar hook protein FlgE [Azospirillum lipoferum]MDW5532715.1 flagellar hook-basal body complex protein [Azospirillum sp. NL1]
MSIFGSMTTAVLGLNAQSKALGHISDNIANSSTIGYKRVDSAFETMVLQSSQRLHEPGGVTAQPVFMNNIQGSLTQVQSPTNIAIQGQGFFSVTKVATQGSSTLVQTQTGTVNSSAAFYTRAGDFELDKSRYLVNSSGYALNGWLVDPVTGVLHKDQVAPIQVNSLIDKPVATNTIDLAANLPATPKEGEKVPDSSIQIFDSQGNPRTVNFKWRQQADSSWRMVLDAPGSNTKPVDGTFSGNPATVTFGQNIPGQTAVAQVNVITIAGNNTNGQDNLRIGDTYSVKVDGTTYSLKVTSDNIGSIRTYSGLAGALANQINSASPAASVLATSSGQTIRVTARNPGTPFKLNTDVVSGTNTTNTIVPQTSTAATASAGEIDKFQFPQTQVEVGDSFTINVNGTPISYTVTAGTYQSYSTVSDVVSQLAGKINQALGTTVTASSAGNILSIQANAVNTNVTSSATVTNSSASVNTMSSLPSVASVAGVRQSRTVTLTGTPGDIGTQYTLSINGTAVTYSTTGEEMTMEDITAALANKINSNTALPVTATAQGGVITVTSKTAASPTNTNTMTGTGTVTLNGSTIDVGDTYTITDSGGTPYQLTITNANYGTYDTPAKVMQYFATVVPGATATGNTLTAAGATGAVTDAPVAQFTLDQSAVAGQTPAHVGLTFGKTPETVGTLTNISTALVGTGTAVSAANQSAGSDATVTFTVDYGFGPQQITLNLGKYQKPGGLTQYAGEEINVTQLVQNGAPRGQFKDVVFGDNGTVMVNYDNGRSKMVAKVPIITFNNPNALQRESGGVFIESEEAGKPNFNDPETNGAGAVVANSVESSNVDIADEFTKMIVTQRSYSANAKIVTTSDEMLQEVLGLKR